MLKDEGYSVSSQDNVKQLKPNTTMVEKPCDGISNDFDNSLKLLKLKAKVVNDKIKATDRYNFKIKTLIQDYIYTVDCYEVITIETWNDMFERILEYLDYELYDVHLIIKGFYPKLIELKIILDAPVTPSFTKLLNALLIHLEEIIEKVRCMKNNKEDRILEFNNIKDFCMSVEKELDVYIEEVKKSNEASETTEDNTNPSDEQNNHNEIAEIDVPQILMGVDDYVRTDRNVYTFTPYFFKELLEEKGIQRNLVSK
ncbi:hypothetical protein COBT_002738 [Conglomerata obtusa]